MGIRSGLSNVQAYSPNDHAHLKFVEILDITIRKVIVLAIRSMRHAKQYGTCTVHDLKVTLLGNINLLLIKGPEPKWRKHATKRHNKHCYRIFSGSNKISELSSI